MPKYALMMREAYIPFSHDDDEQLAFEKADVEVVKERWKDGWCVYCIADEIGRDPDFILVLLIDLGRRGTIERPAGHLSWWMPCTDCKGD